MKILIIHNKYRSKNIGGEDIVYKNEVDILQSKIGMENVITYDVSNDKLSKIALLFEIWFSIRHYKKVYNLIKKHKIDIVHVHNFFPMLTPSVFKAGKDAGALVIHTLHNYRLWCISGTFYRNKFGICEICAKKKFSLAGIFNKCYRESIIQSVLAQLSFCFYRKIKIYKYIDYYFVLTNFQKDKIESLGIKSEQIVLKPNCVKKFFFTNKKKEGYIYVGRLEESKGIYKILQAWEKLDDKYCLSIIGTGNLEEELRNKYEKNNIIFKGKCSQEETLHSISKAKYLVQPSIGYETFGLTIIEAMSVGTPVIGFDVGTRKDFIVDEQNGFLCNMNNLEKIVENSYNYKEYRKLQENAMKTAEKYQNTYIIDKQLEIYKNILENR